MLLTRCFNRRTFACRRPWLADWIEIWESGQSCVIIRGDRRGRMSQQLLGMEQAEGGGNVGPELRAHPTECPTNPTAATPTTAQPPVIGGYERWAAQKGAQNEWQEGEFKVALGPLFG